MNKRTSFVWDKTETGRAIYSDTAVDSFGGVEEENSVADLHTE
jgi:hypothetical protein